MLKSVKELLAWQKAYKLALDTYRLTDGFPKKEQYILVPQIRRAAISVSGNIAEGYERGHRKEYVQFLMIARGSLSELETYFLLAKDLGYMHESNYDNIEISRKETARLLQGLLRSLATNP